LHAPRVRVWDMTRKQGSCSTAGADPNAGDDYGHTSLHWAAQYPKSPAVLGKCLDLGADPKARDKNRKPPGTLRKNKALKGTDAFRRLKEARD